MFVYVLERGPDPDLLERLDLFAFGLMVVGLRSDLVFRLSLPELLNPKPRIPHPDSNQNPTVPRKSCDLSQESVVQGGQLLD